MSYIKDDKYHEEILNSYMKDVLLSSDDNKKNLPPKMKIVSEELNEIIKISEAFEINTSGIWKENILPKIKQRALNGYRNYTFKISELNSEFNIDRLRNSIRNYAEYNGYNLSKFEPYDMITMSW